MIILKIILIIGWSILTIALLRKPNEYTLKNSTSALTAIVIALHLIVDIVIR